MQGGHIGGADHADETPLTFMAKAEFLIGAVEANAPDRRRAQAPQASGLGHPTAPHLDETRQARVWTIPGSHRPVRSLKAQGSKGGKS